jgi:DNA-binding transcriptional LysR family regulator
MTARIEAARTEVQDICAGAKGKLVILSDSQFSTAFVSHVTRTFMRRHPNLECELYMAGRADSPGIEEVDCYVCEQELEMPNLIAKPVGTLRYGLYASPIYLRRPGVPATPAVWLST